jgi:cytoskeletal protein CcmA (bactofilin family)
LNGANETHSSELSEEKGRESRMTDEKQTLVEEGTSFKGSITSTCPVVVRGRIEGDIETPALTVSASGAVHGKAKVGVVQSEGEIAGQFDAETVQLSGRVLDNTVIRANSLEVRLASSDKMQVVFGNCELNVGGDPKETSKSGDDE